MSSPADLPDDIAALKALVAGRDAALAHKEVVVTELREQLSTRSAEIEHLKLWIAKPQRMLPMPLVISSHGGVAEFLDWLMQ